MSKQSILQDMLALLKSGRSKGELRRVYVRDTDGQNVRLDEPEARQVIERRLAEIEGEE